jgi:hypothetical protein
MNCHTCHTAVPLARKVQIREVDADPERTLPPFATAFVCQECYHMLDTVDGVGLIDGRLYQVDQASRFGKAPLFSRDMHDDYLRAEALKLTAVPS